MTCAGSLTLMDRMGMRDYVEFDPEVIRGLDYYTGHRLRSPRSQTAGGRFLAAGITITWSGTVGGDPLPAVGFAMGDVMITDRAARNMG